MRCLMPKRTKVTTIKEEMPELPAENTDQIPVLDESTLEFSERLQEIRAKLGGASDDVTIKVYRVTSGKNPAFCFSDKDVDEEKIQKRCGAGSYLCKVIAGGSVLESIEVDIDATAMPISTTTSGNEPIITLLMQQNAQLMQAFTQIAANGGNNNHQPSMLDLVNTMKGLRDLAGGESNSMKMFEKGIELASKVAGYGEKHWSSELLETVKEVAAPILPALIANATGKTIPTPATPVQELPPMTEEQQREAFLKSAIVQIKEQSLRGVPAGLVLEWIENHANEYAPLIRSVITSDFSDIAKLDSDVAGSEPLQTYLKTIYDGLRSAYNESATNDLDTTGEIGDEDNDTENGDVGTQGSNKPRVVVTSTPSRASKRN